jgi:glycosyltransferase involved in cell wall biosynthesis
MTSGADAGSRPASCRPAVSVVLCTFNRSHLLPGALDALLRQSPASPPYEIIVVDNASTDDTRAVAGRFLSGIVRYAFEERPGLSAARNHGLALARAPIVAFTDDDIRVSREWVRTIVETFDAHGDVDMIGGPVEPEWEAPPPAWLRHTGDAPLAIVDYGSQPFLVTPDRPACLLGANLAVRRALFDRVGLFSTDLQRVADGIGSTEDQELEVRILAAGRLGLYEPRLVVRAPVPRERLSKRYHRVWHQGHGRFYALMRDPAFERSGRGTLLGVPGHVYRSVVNELAAWALSALSFQRSAAFAHELRLRFLIAFARTRIFQRS